MARRKQDQRPSPWDVKRPKAVRRSRKELRTLQELYAPTWRERICRTLNPETMQFESSLTDIWADYHRGRVERWFERDWENGNYDGVLDFIAIRGPVALERDWVHAAITAQHETARQGGAASVSAKRFLKAVGEALACTGQGAIRRLNTGNRRRIAAAYSETLPKIQRLCHLLDRSDDAPMQATENGRKEMAERLSEVCQLDAGTCHDVLLLRIPATNQHRPTPSQITIRLVAREFGCGERAIQSVVRESR